MAGTEHLAGRPEWDCRSCGRPWPCDPAREGLIAEMDRTALSVYMWVNLEEAVLELPRTPASELFERFIAWTNTHQGLPFQPPRGG
jgi:hypothetical protein